MEIFYKYSWEGNVRELENLIEGVMSIYDIEIIELKHLPAKFQERKKSLQQSFPKGNPRNHRKRFNRKCLKRGRL